MTLRAASKPGTLSGGGTTTMRPPLRPLPQPSLASPLTRIVTPFASVKPSDWPADPERLMVMESSGRPSAPHTLDTWLLSMVPSVRSTFVVTRSRTSGSKATDAAALEIRSCAAATRSLSILSSSSWSWKCKWRMPAAGFNSADGWSSGARSRPRTLSGRRELRTTFGSTSSTSPAAPTSSSIDFMPSEWSTMRISSAINQKKFMTCSGLPSNLRRSSGSCVAMPTGHVFKWHLRIMMQPRAISGPVEKANSSAPRAQAMATSRDVLIWPSVCSLMRSRRPLSTSVCCASATPSSQGRPAALMPVQAAAPVPPSPPETTMWSALAFATPAATTPTPTSETSLTLTLPPGLAHLRSWMSWARSSME
mmetsp:Transcript_24767/g.83234  ORF Transcript_24767/g.83234 Transcript_24767/m.83234 type:complete len:365 (-) Transcript_24767:3195-4289(-)